MIQFKRKLKLDIKCVFYSFFTFQNMQLSADTHAKSFHAGKIVEIALICN